MSELVISEYHCAPSPADGGGYRVTAIVGGIPVSGWVNVPSPELTAYVAANLRVLAERHVS